MLRFLKNRLSKKGSNKKVVVLGLDGVPFSLLERFIKEGLMPNLDKLTEKGTFAPMTAPIPEVSSTSWSTFMTGVNPGKHGIYGFTELQGNSYRWRFPNFNDLKSETLWDIAGRYNKRSIVLNVPSTYPARELNGIITAGFVSLDLQKATYPQSAYEYLQKIDYKMDVDTRKAKESSEALAENIQQTFYVRKRALLHFLENDEWNLFIGVVTETDRLHHYLWIALQDEQHPQHKFFLDFYKDLDTFIGEMFRRTENEIPFLIISDHGFTTIKKEVYLNIWLKERGYLKFKKDKPESFEDMLSQSTVFSLDPARFYIHLKNKYPDGSVEDSEYDGIRQKLRNELLSLKINGEKVTKTVFLKEEIYHGSFNNHAPDLVALPNEGYDLKGSINKTQISGSSFLTGAHTRDDAVFYINREASQKDINIIDIGPTIISLLGIEEQGFDGKCLVGR
jgi:predicted AlkP superfamily phosphohydrolase/phosphomutase